MRGDQKPRWLVDDSKMTYFPDSRTAELVGEYKGSLKNLFQTRGEGDSRKETNGLSPTYLLRSFVSEKACLPCHTTGFKETV